MDMPAAGLGQRPASVISSDQEYPPLEHKEIPVPSPYARRIQQQEHHGQSKLGPKTPPKSSAILEGVKIASRHNSESIAEAICKSQDGVYAFQEAMITNERLTAETAIRNETPLMSEKLGSSEKERQASTDVQCQKTVSNAKNDQIRVSMREKLAKNKEEVSEKRSSFSEIEKPNNHTDKVSFPCENSVAPAIIENLLNSSVSARLESSKDLITRNNINENSKISIDIPDKASVEAESENLEQVQTTWELEKQKADQLAMMRLSENSVADLSRHFSTNQSTTPPVVTVSPIQTKGNEISDEHHGESESSLVEDEDSSDAKTITNLDGPPSLRNDDSNRTRCETPAKPINTRLATVTPDTMTPDEAENLLSSR